MLGVYVLLVSSHDFSQERRYYMICVTHGRLNTSITSILQVGSSSNFPPVKIGCKCWREDPTLEQVDSSILSQSQDSLALKKKR